MTTTIERENGMISFRELAGLLDSGSVNVVRLTNLKINGDEEEAFRLAKIIRGHPGLEEIYFTKLSCTDEAMNLDSTIEMMLISCPNLRILKLEDVPVRAKSIGTLTYYASLTTLSLPGNRYTDADAKLIADAVWNCTSIESVDLSCNNISGAACKAFEICLEKNKSIKKIDLSGNHISAAEGTSLEAKLRARAAVAA